MKQLAPLTQRERQIGELVCKGLTNPEIGRRLGIAEATVKHHLLNAMYKTNARARAQFAVQIATGAAK
jgi:DNA-binding NarL/FixJ family response regulator